MPAAGTTPLLEQGVPRDTCMRVALLRLAVIAGCWATVAAAGAGAVLAPGSAAASAACGNCGRCERGDQLIACEGCGLAMFCSSACRSAAFASGAVHPVLAHLGPRWARGTLLCGGDRGNGLRGDERGDPSLCEAPPAIALAGSQSVALARDREEQAGGGVEASKGEEGQWPAVAIRRPDALAPSYPLVPIPPEIERRTRVEDTQDMGRVLVAAEHIKAGELAVQEAPLMVWPTGGCVGVWVCVGVWGDYVCT